MQKLFMIFFLAFTFTSSVFAQTQYACETLMMARAESMTNFEATSALTDLKAHRNVNGTMSFQILVRRQFPFSARTYEITVDNYQNCNILKCDVIGYRGSKMSCSNSN